MFVQFKPKGEPVQSYDFDPADVFQSQAEMVEKRYGQNWDAFVDGVKDGEAKARKVLLWHLMRTVHHNLRFEDTPDFRMGELVVEFSSSELRTMIHKLGAVDRNVLTAERSGELDGIESRLQTELTDALLREHEASAPDDVPALIEAGADPGLGKAL